VRTLRARAACASALLRARRSSTSASALALCLFSRGAGSGEGLLGAFGDFLAALDFEVAEGAFGAFSRGGVRERLGDDAFARLAFGGLAGELAGERGFERGFGISAAAEPASEAHG
jgi:hypothetical protein